MRSLFMIGCAYIMMMHIAKASTWFWQNSSDVCVKAPYTPQGLINYGGTDSSTKIYRNSDNSIAEVDVFILNTLTDVTSRTVFFKTIGDCKIAGGSVNTNELK